MDFKTSKIPEYNLSYHAKFLVEFGKYITT
jgi:hypothetical protein